MKPIYVFIICFCLLLALVWMLLYFGVVDFDMFKPSETSLGIPL